MQTLARALPDALPDKIAALTGAARDLTSAASQLGRLQLDRAKDFGASLRERLGGMADSDTGRSLAHFTRHEFDRAQDFGGVLQQRLSRAMHRDRRASRLPLILTVAVVGVAVGGALLASPRVRNGLRQGWDRVRGRRQDQALEASDGMNGAAWKPPRERQEDLLDEGIEESFPASDPVSVNQIT